MLRTGYSHKWHHLRRGLRLPLKRIRCLPVLRISLPKTNSSETSSFPLSADDVDWQSTTSTVQATDGKNLVASALKMETVRFFRNVAIYRRVYKAPKSEDHLIIQAAVKTSKFTLTFNIPHVGKLNNVRVTSDGYRKSFIDRESFPLEWCIKITNW